MGDEKEWVQCTVTLPASDIKQQQWTLRKKVFGHAHTKAHLTAAGILDKGKRVTLVQAIFNSQNRQPLQLEYFAQRTRRLNTNGFEHEVDFQELNEVDMGRILHSNVVCKYTETNFSRN